MNMAHIKLENELDKILLDGKNRMKYIIFIVVYIILFIFAWSIYIISRHVYSTNLKISTIFKMVIAILSILICLSPFLCISIFSQPHGWSEYNVINSYYLWFSIGWIFIVISIAVWLKIKDRNGVGPR